MKIKLSFIHWRFLNAESTFHSNILLRDYNTTFLTTSEDLSRNNGKELALAEDALYHRLTARGPYVWYRTETHQLRKRNLEEAHQKRTIRIKYRQKPILNLSLLRGNRKPNISYFNNDLKE